MSGRYVMEFERPLAELERKLQGLKDIDISGDPALATEIEALTRRINELKRTLYTSLTPWQKVQVARHPDRPKTQDYLRELFEDVVELRGDRAFRDDQAIVTAIASIDGRGTMVIGHRKGRTTKENLAYHFGMAHPEGFRKAIRAMRLADRFGLPVVTFIDTQGAYPGVGAEERGVAWAIAECLATITGVRVPVVAVGIGEGGSGGALAVGYGDRLIMLENSYYSVITPEACASILFKDPGRAPDVVDSLWLTADEVRELGIADEVLREPLGGAHCDHDEVFGSVREAVVRALDGLGAEPVDALLARRRERLHRVGMVKETTDPEGD